MKLPFYSFSLSFEPGGNRAFSAGTIWHTDTVKFVLADSRITVHYIDRREPTPENVRSVLFDCYKNSSEHLNESIRDANHEETLAFIKLSKGETQRLVVGNYFYDQNGNTSPFTVPSQYKGQSDELYSYNYSRWDFNMLFVADRALGLSPQIKHCYSQGIWVNGVLIQAYSD